MKLTTPKISRTFQTQGRFLKSKTTKNEIIDSKDLKDIPNTNYSKTKNQTATMIRK